MLLCLFLCALPLAIPAIVHVAAIVLLAFGIGDAADVITFAPYSAPVPVAPYSAPDRPSIRMPSPPCRVRVTHSVARAELPIVRAPRSASGRFGRVAYSASNESYNLSLTVSG